MKNIVAYRIVNVPDVALPKNKIGAHSGLDGILELHNSFLRIWNRKGLVSDISLHLFYKYNPELRNEGNIEAYLALRGEENNLREAATLFEALSLIKKYNVELVHLFEKEQKSEYKICAFLTKKEVILKKEEDDDGSVYYTVPEWKLNDEARLYEMFTVMEALGKSVLYRVDLYACDYGIRVRERVDKQIRKFNSIMENASSASPFGFVHKDKITEKVIGLYDSIASKFEKSPHFIANICCFANLADDAKLILDAAGADAVEEGSYNISAFKGEFSMLSLIEKDLDSDKYIGMKSCAENNSAIESIVLKEQTAWKVCTEQAQKYVLNFLPVLFTLEEIIPFFRLPIIDDGEIIPMKLESDYEPKADSEVITIGVDAHNRKFEYPLKLFSKHAFISGVPGSGKTNTMLHFVTELHKKEIPFLVLESAKKEYRAIYNYGEEMNDIILFSPHMHTLFPIEVNPLEFPQGITLCEHINVLMKVFSSTFEVEGGMYHLLDEAIETAYKQREWNYYDVNTGGKKYPCLKDVYNLYGEAVNKTGYDIETKNNLRTFLELRLGGLMSRDAGEVFDVNGSSLMPEEWLDSSVIIEMEDMGEHNKNFLILLLCNYIRETLKVRKRNDKILENINNPKHVIFIEEAHNVISNTSEQQDNDVNPKVSATKFIIDMLAEVRALNESIIIADQLPSSMVEEVMKNTGLKIVHRMTAQDERQYIGSTMSASPIQLDNLSKYSQGKSLVFFEGLEKPIEVQITKWSDCDDKYISMTDEDLGRKLCKSSKSKYKEFLETNIEKLLYKSIRSEASTENRNAVEAINIKISNYEKIISENQEVI